MLGEPHSTPEPVIAPLPNPGLSNYLIVYAYESGQVEFHCSNLDPVLQFKMLAIMADAMSNGAKQLQEQAVKEQSRIKLVN